MAHLGQGPQRMWGSGDAAKHVPLRFCFRTEVFVSSLGDQCLSGLALCQSYSSFGESQFQGLVIQGYKELVPFSQFKTALPGI